MGKANKIENIQNLQECVNYIMDNRAGWSSFTSWYMEKYGANRKYANVVWKSAWEIIMEDFEDNVRQSVNETLLELEVLKEEAREDGDRKIWLEVVKYQNKIRGGEVERHTHEVKGNITIDVNFSDDTPFS